jgi:hypothetical protein
MFTAYVRTKAGKITLCAMPCKWRDVEETAANMSKRPMSSGSASLLMAGSSPRSRAVSGLTWKPPGRGGKAADDVLKIVEICSGTSRPDQTSGVDKDSGEPAERPITAIFPR